MAAHEASLPRVPSFYLGLITQIKTGCGVAQLWCGVAQFGAAWLSWFGAAWLSW
jgi:hypothetical protein